MNPISTPGSSLSAMLRSGPWRAMMPMNAEGTRLTDRFESSPQATDTPRYFQPTLPGMPTASLVSSSAAAGAIPGVVGATLRFVLLGPPGSGKSTQGQILSQDKGIPHVSVGDLIRQEVASGSELGQRLEEETRGGKLAPPALVRDLIQDRLEREDAAQGFILDGYPRQDEQLAEFEEMRQEMGWGNVLVLGLEVPEEEVTRRLAGRGRADDTPEVIRNRMEIYRQETEPVMDYFRSRGEYLGIDGNGTIEEVSQRLRDALEERQSNNS